MNRLWLRTVITQLACALILAVSVGFILRQEVGRNMRKNFLVSSQSSALSLAKAIEPALIQRDVVAIQSTLDSSLKLPNVEWACVLSPEGRVLAHTLVPTFPERLRVELTSMPLDHTSLEPRIVDDLAPELGWNPALSYSVFKVPVLNGIVGQLALACNQDELRSSLKRTENLVLWTLLITLALATVGFLWLAHHITRPIIQLTNASRELARDPEMRIESLNEDGPAEIRELTRAFQNMALQIREQHRDLEAKVVARTAELTLLKNAAESSSEAKSRFLATMSHEIRTPMNGVIGFIQLLEDTPLRADQLDLLRTAKNSAQALLTILNDILDFSRIESGKLELESVPFSPATTLREVIELLSATADAKRIELAYSVPPHFPHNILGDPCRFRQILMNLAGNAVKFTSQGHVFISMHWRDADSPAAAQGELTVEVQDTGEGMNAQTLEGLFESFQQADSSTTRRFGGTGLGLAISKRLVQCMQGHIGVESEPGRGSRFWFSLPARTAPPDETHHNTPDPVPDRAPPAKTLLLTQTTVIRDLLTQQFQQWNWRLECSDSTDSALERIRSAFQNQAPFSHLLIDFRGPSLDGVDFGLKLKNDPQLASTQFILLTPGSQRAEVDRLQSLGFHACLLKPILRVDTLQSLLTGPGPVCTNNLSSPSGQEPRQVAPPLSDADQPVPSPESQNPRPKVLLVEDNRINQRLALMLLERLGFQGEVAENGFEALEKLKSCDAYQLVLMDCQMPELDGLQTTRKIREIEAACSTERNSSPFHHTKRIPVIALTANALQDDRDKCAQAGMDDYMSKPIEVPMLRQILSKWCPAVGEGKVGASPAPGKKAA